MRILLLAASSLGLAFAPQAAVSSQPPPSAVPSVVGASAPAGARPAAARPLAKKPAPVAAPAPHVVLALDAPTPRGPWTMRVTNADEVPVRLTADARMLTLDVTTRGSRAAVRCELPGDMRPSDELESALVVPPGRSYAETFEPRLYCFGAAKLDALTPGATVVGHLGWAGRAASPPFAVASIDGVTPEVSPMKWLDSPAIALPDEPALQPDATPASLAEVGVPRLTLAGGTAVDSTFAEGIEIPVTVRNDGSDPVVVRLRPETLGFDVIGPDSVQACVWPASPGAAVREAYTRVAPRGAATLSVLLSAYCAGHALDQAGLYVVRPRLDTRRTSGESLGYRSFEGVLVAATPTVVRLHRGMAIPRLRRPRLEPKQP